jgi:hypothetical protein
MPKAGMHDEFMPRIQEAAAVDVVDVASAALELIASIASLKEDVRSRTGHPIEETEDDHGVARAKAIIEEHIPERSYLGVQDPFAPIDPLTGEAASAVASALETLRQFQAFLRGMLDGKENLIATCGFQITTTAGLSEECRSDLRDGEELEYEPGDTTNITYDEGLVEEDVESSIVYHLAGIVPRLRGEASATRAGYEDVGEERLTTFSVRLRLYSQEGGLPEGTIGALHAALQGTPGVSTAGPIVVHVTSDGR